MSENPISSDSITMIFGLFDSAVEVVEAHDARNMAIRIMEINFMLNSFAVRKIYAVLRFDMTEDRLNFTTFYD